MGNKIRALGASLVSLGSLMLAVVDRPMAWTPGAWLNIGGLVPILVGDPALKPGQPVKTSLRNHALGLDSFLAVKQYVCPRVWS
jgi:hypothetical protein